MRGKEKAQRIIGGCIIAFLVMCFAPAESVAFGLNVGEHCWVHADDPDYLTIRLQVTRFGRAHAVHGAVSIHDPDFPSNTPVHGSAIFDPLTERIKIAVTQNRADRVINALLDIDPQTGDGHKHLVVVGTEEYQRTDDILHVPCGNPR